MRRRRTRRVWCPRCERDVLADDARRLVAHRTFTGEACPLSGWLPPADNARRRN